jgi:hypothetical protein
MERKKYEDLRGLLRSGDILFFDGDNAISHMVEGLTGGSYGHIAILLQLPTRQMVVMESILTGIRCVTLEDGYLKNYLGFGRPYKGSIHVARHKLFPSGFDSLEFYKKSFSMLGDQYNVSDIFRMLVRIVRGKFGMMSRHELRPNKKFVCSEYVFECFKHINIDLKSNRLGFVSPNDIAKDPNIEFLYKIDV